MVRAEMADDLRFLGLDTTVAERVGFWVTSRPVCRVGPGMKPFAFALAVVVAACSSGTTAPPFDGTLALGTWGGENSGMIVSDTAMHLHVACTFGDVSGRIALAANGQFDVAGSYLLRAYPIAIGPTMPARFVGRVEASKATITVTVNDTVEHKSVVLGPVVVTWGAEPKMGPCPICRRPILTQRRGVWARIREAFGIR